MNIKKLLDIFISILGFMILFSGISNANPLDNWHLRSPFSLSYPLKGVGYGNNTFVAVGVLGTILMSPDGINWTAKVSGTPKGLNGVTHGNDTFVVVGNGGTILTSVDGETWIARSSGTPYDLLGVAYGNGTFIAVQGSIILTSPNGVTWTQTFSGASGYLAKVVYGNNIFVAVGYDGSTILTSSDGVTWAKRTTGAVNTLWGLAYGNGTFVAAGVGGRIITSPDGMEWTERSSGTSHSLYGVGYGNCTFIAIGTYGDILNSPDGVIWTPRASGSSASLSDVVYGDDTFVVVGSNGAILQSDSILNSPLMSVNPPSLNFRNVTVLGSVDKSVTVGNYGTADLIISTVNSPSPPFSKIVDTCSDQVLPPGDSCFLTYRFSPDSEGTFSGNSDLLSNDSKDLPFPLSFIGTGVSSSTQDITVIPTSLNFGAITKGALSKENVTIKNEGTENLLITGLNMSPIQGFHLVYPKFPVTIPPGDSYIVTVFFEPPGVGSFSSGFDIQSNDPDENPVTVSLIGTAVETDITITPAYVNFGNVWVGANSEQTITVQNDGTADLLIGTIGKPSSPFARIGGTCSDGSALTPGENCTIMVRFSPTSTGSFYSSFLITSDDPDEQSLGVNLSGTGVVSDITIDEISLNFGNVLLGSVVEETIIVRNDGQTNLLIDAVSSPSLPFFIIDDNCLGQTILPSGGCSINVGCMPTWKGAISSSFDIFSNDPDERQVTIHLNGRGVHFIVNPNEGTVGSRIQITGFGFGTIAGNVLIGGTSLDVLEWSDGAILCSLSKVVPAATYDLMIQPIGMLSLVEESTFTIKAPVIEFVKSDGLAEEQIAMSGYYFGTMGEVYIGTIRCGVTKWTMDPVTGTSTVDFTVPGLAPGNYHLIVRNGIGEAAVHFSITPTITISYRGTDYVLVNNTTLDATLTRVDLSGQAYHIPSWCYPCDGTIPENKVKVTWINSTTGVSGEAFQWVRIGSMLGMYIHTWFASVPLVAGDNLITVTASDPSGGWGQAVIAIRGIPPAAEVNHLPVALTQEVITYKSIPKTIRLTATDPDGDPITYSIAENPSHGTLSGILPNVIYTPAIGYTGSDAFSFEVNDGKGYSVVRISIRVIAPSQIDYDGDGVTDISVWQPGDGYWYILNSEDGSYVFDAIGVGGGSQWKPVPGDYDGDGKTDVTVYDADYGWWLFHYTAGGYFYDHIGVGGTGYVPVPGDYDGDGVADIAVYNVTNGDWYIKYSNGGYGFDSLGGTGSIPFPADYDGDGKTDIAVYDVANGWWYLHYSSDGSYVFDAIGVGGGSQWKPVPGDYDGDGKADVAVYDALNGWWLFHYTAGGYFYDHIGVGGTGYGAVPGDYDGDGVTDIAVYGETNGYWFIKYSNGGYGFDSLGGSGSVPVNPPYLYGSGI